MTQSRHFLLHLERGVAMIHAEADQSNPRTRPPPAPPNVMAILLGLKGRSGTRAGSRIRNCSPMLRRSRLDDRGSIPPAFRAGFGRSSGACCSLSSTQQDLTPRVGSGIQFCLIVCDETAEFLFLLLLVGKLTIDVLHLSFRSRILFWRATSGIDWTLTGAA